jgi:hypothetical protein
MSYALTLACGCVVYVACNPRTHLAHTRIVERRGAACSNRKHDIGTRLYLWELLPEKIDSAAVEWLDEHQESANR